MRATIPRGAPHLQLAQPFSCSRINFARARLHAGPEPQNGSSFWDSPAVRLCHPSFAQTSPMG